MTAIASMVCVTLAIAGCATGPSAATSASPVSSASPTVVTIGDSIMKGNGVSPDEAWPAIVAAQDGWNLTNLACNGAGFLTPGDDSDCAETFSGLVALTVALKPETVIISGSSNDFGRDDSALVEETTTEIAQLRSALPNARIIGLSTVWGDTDVPAQLAQVNSQVQQAVEKVGGTYLDIGQPLQGHPEWMQWDGVHPTAAGQLALSAAIQIAFREGQIRI